MLLLMSPHFLLIAMAVIPAAVLMRYVYRSDHLEKESPRLLGRLVLQGIIATAVAALLEMIGQRFLGDPKTYRDLMWQCVFIGLAEEGAKFAFLYYRTWRNPEFNCQFDGVVYAVFVSLGFALWENIRYVLSYGFSTALIRAVTAVPGHACFGVFMGVWYGLAKRYELLGDMKSRKKCLVLSLILSAAVHALYDYIAMAKSGSSEWIFFAFIAVLFFVSFRLVKKTSAADIYLPHQSRY